MGFIPRGPARYTIGLRAHTALIEVYGEHHWLSCSGVSLTRPRWVFVLE
jgi:hypothetical protein